MPHPKIIYAEIDEEITSIFDRIKRLRNKNIYLSIPSRAALFQSVVNLRILRKKSQEIEKKIIIVTDDRIGKKLGEQAGFEVINKIELNPKGKEKGKEKSNVIHISPIAAETNKFDTQKPFIRKEKKITLRDMISPTKKTKKKDDKHEKAQSYALPKPNRKSILMVIAISIILFLFIIYIALPGANIYIRPKSEMLEQPVNIILADAEINKDYLSSKPMHSIPSYSIETVFEKTVVFETISQEFYGTPSAGKIKIINSTSNEWPLKEKTQFESPDGIIFRTKNWVTVPPKVDEKNGEILVNVEADPFDAYANPVGDRGNIDPTSFTIRKLSKYNQQLIWGESNEKMIGGTSEYQKIVSEEDLDQAKVKVEAEILESAKENLQDYVDERNILNKSNLVLLEDPNYMYKEILEMKIPEDIIGKEIDKFEVYTKIRIKSIAFSYDRFMEILKRDLKSRVHPDMQLREDLIAADSVQYKVIDQNDSLQHIKLSVNIKGVQEYVIEPTSKSGMNFVNRIREKVAGLNITEAEHYINNLTEVDEVEISVWPFWASTLPKVPENIHLLLKEA